MPSKAKLMKREHHKFNFIKNYDMFGSKLTLNFNKFNPIKGEMTYYEALGSYIGMFLTIIVCFTCSIYFISLLNDMFAGENDIINQMIFTNSDSQVI